jgi:outer membrane lipoprotein-sorting protein
MVRTHFVRRAARLLGAVTVAGVLSTGAIAATPAAAQDRTSAISGYSFDSVQRYALTGNGLWLSSIQGNGL